MELFMDAVLFWAAGAFVYTCFKFGGELYDILRAKYIVWSWKRRK